MTFLWGVSPAREVQAEQLQTVKVVAPDGLSTKVYSKPSLTSDVLATVLHDELLEALGEKDNFIEVSLQDKKISGFIPMAHTTPWSPPPKTFFTPFLIGLIVALVVAMIAGAFFYVRARRRTRDAQKAAQIPATIKRAEELYRTGEYGAAIDEFEAYLSMQDVRNPDVYRRLAVCYHKIGETKEAFQQWEKMRSLAGLRTSYDYTIGVELMTALGKEADAAQIYEEFLESDVDRERIHEIHEKLFDVYRKLKDPAKFLEHALKLMALKPADTRIVSVAANFLITEGRTDLALETNHKDLIKEICEEYLEDQVVAPDAWRVYLKCSEYDRTDLRLHRILANIYTERGDVRRAVSELTILHQLDKEQSEDYVTEAARLYVDNERVGDALAEGNPLIIKKVAQTFLSHSEVHPDAVATYEKVLEFQPRAVGINKILSTVYLTRGQLDKYMAKLRLLHEIDGANHDYLNDLAACVIDNDLIEATLKEGNRDLNARILRQIMKSGSHDDRTLALLEKLNKYDPDSVAVHSALVRAYETRKEPEKCLQHLLRLIELQPDAQELVEKAASFALNHSLLETVMDNGGKLLVSTALEIVKRKASDPRSLALLERAAQEQPQPSIANYLNSLGRAVPEPKPIREQEVKTKAQSLPETAPKKRSSRATESKRPVKAGDKLESSRHKHEAEVTVHGAEKKATADSRSQKTTASEPEESAETGPSASGAAAVPEPPQVVQIMDTSAPVSAEAVTTFVSGHARGRQTVEYKQTELFFPATGGLAYRDTELIFNDGWGKLSFGVEVRTSRNVLLRVFRKDLLDESAMKDFLKAVTEVGYNLAHDNILHLEEVVTGAGGSSGFIYPYMARTLEQVVQSGESLELEAVLGIISKIVDTLAYSHQYKGLDGKIRRTFHHHLQPSHVLVSRDLKDCRLTSLGFSQVFRTVTNARQPRWQDPGMNPATMPPEFFLSRGGIIKERAAEVYSLGILIHLAVTGQYPFDGPGLSEYKHQHRTLPPTPLRLLNPQAPIWLEQIVLKCLEKEPEKRWGSVTEIQREIRRTT